MTGRETHLFPGMRFGPVNRPTVTSSEPKSWTLARPSAWTLLTVATVAGMELAARDIAKGPLYLGYSAPFALFVIVFAAFRGGTRSGLFSTFCFLAYYAYSLSLPHHFLTFSQDNVKGMWIVILTFPLVALMVGSLKAHLERTLMAGAEREAGLLRANEQLHREQIELLKQTDASKDRFLSILSHEMRTPINAITGFASILEDEVLGPLTDRQQECVRKILDGSDSLLVLVNDLLDLNRIQAGKFSLSPGWMSFAPCADRIVSALEALIAQRHQHLVLEIDQELPPLFADEQRLGQVVMNLVTNAIKFSPDGGRITIRAAVWEEGLWCEVEDQGPGISAEDAAKLFQPFTQLDLALPRKINGSGLGLSICKALVEAHGGRIGVNSAEQGGSTFWFTVPLSPPC